MTFAKCFCAAALTFGSIAALACEHPTLVEIPETVESRRDTQRVRAAMEMYVQGMLAYTECIQAELAAAGGDAAPNPLKGLLVMRNNAAVAEVNAVVELFEARVPPEAAEDQ